MSSKNNCWALPLYIQNVRLFPFPHWAWGWSAVDRELRSKGRLVKSPRLFYFPQLWGCSAVDRDSSRSKRSPTYPAHVVIGFAHLIAADIYLQAFTGFKVPGWSWYYTAGKTVLPSVLYVGSIKFNRLYKLWYLLRMFCIKQPFVFALSQSAESGWKPAANSCFYNSCFYIKWSSILH